ncbi:MAG TPA: hypothetical protein PKK26_03190 [Candidatus Wallbacteria bacterium]|nr:hypothetical protein [Candidatus Wallbacteria bacterium]
MKKIIPVLISIVLAAYIGYLSYGLISKSVVSDEKNASEQKIKRSLNTTKKPAGNVNQPERPGSTDENALIRTSTEEVSTPVKKHLPPPQQVKDIDIKKLKYAAVKGSGVNVRSESRIAPNNVMDKVNSGEIFDVVAIEKPANDNHKWIKLRLKNGSMGFIRDDLVELREKK